MKIVIAHNEIIPVSLYGGTERVVWCLGKELSALGHEVIFLVKKGSHCNFATVIPVDDSRGIEEQIPADADIVHFNYLPPGIDRIAKPYVITRHGNVNHFEKLYRNMIFVSKDHAERHGSVSWVYNGLNWNEYMPPTFQKNKNYFHFLGKAAWRLKNVQGAIDTIKKTKREKLKVLGGVRFNINMGLRFTFSPRIHFYGMVGGQKKQMLLDGSKGLLFPVRWNEPFGLAIIESLYYGCPVFGTPYGSLKELVPDYVGYLSNDSTKLAAALENSSLFSPKTCHEYAKEKFNSLVMAKAYLEKYERVLSGEFLNDEHPALKEMQTEKFLEWIK